MIDMRDVREGDFVKHKTIAWMNRGKPFHVIKIENEKAYCEYLGKNNILQYHEFDLNQLVIVDKPAEE